MPRAATTVPCAEPPRPPPRSSSECPHSSLACGAEMRDDPSMQAPIAWRDIVPSQYDGLFLTGGHAPGMRQYLENSTLQQKIVEFWKLDRPVGAVCHGTLLLARCVDPDTERSVLYGRTTSTLPGVCDWSSFVVARTHQRQALTLT